MGEVTQGEGQTSRPERSWQEKREQRSVGGGVPPGAQVPAGACGITGRTGGGSGLSGPAFLTLPQHCCFPSFPVLPQLAS